MESAVDALKIAFAVIVFVIALSLSIYMFTEARITADAVLHSSDITEFMDYEETTAENENRIVGLETIIPTLYRYYKENYTVVFRNNSGSYLQLYQTKTNIASWSTNYTNQYYGGQNRSICAFDVDDETSRHEPWTGNAKYYKQNIDAFLSGGRFYYPSGNGEYYEYTGFIKKYKNSKFIEDLGKYNYTTNGEETDETDSSGTTKERTKRIIIYTLQN